MPQATIQQVSKLVTFLASASNNFALAGVCSNGSPSLSYTFDPEQIDSVVTSLGNGVLAEAVMTQLRYGRRRVTAFPITPTTAGVIGSITHTGSGPTVTAAALAASGSVLVAGPYDSLHVAVKITSGGAAGTAKFQYSLDAVTDAAGTYIGSWSGDVTVPAALPAEIVGTVALNNTLAAALGTTTFIATSDIGPATTTFASPATPTLAAAAVDTAGSTNYDGDLVGNSKIRVRSPTLGAASTLLIGAGTANAALGFTGAATATGSAATFTIPGTGVVLTFAAGTYVLGDVYAFDTVAPLFAPAALTALFVRVETKIAANEPIGALWITQEDPDTIESRSMLNALSTALTASRVRKFYFWGLMSVTKDDSDTDVLLRCGTFEDSYIVCGAGDYYSAGGALTGSYYHRPYIWHVARKAARDRFSSDLGNHADGKASSDLGFTATIRDERTATTKLATFRTPQTGTGGGFCVAESTTSGEVYTYQGRTMAAFGLIEGDASAMRVRLAASRQLQKDLDTQINNDIGTKQTGVLTDAEEDRLSNLFTSNLRTLLFEDPDAPEGHASGLADVVPFYTLSTKTLTAAFEIQRRAPLKSITAGLAIVDTLSTAVTQEV
jgi:hypothetical protein